MAEFGYAVAGQAASGSAAIDLAGSTEPDLVLMDIRLHGSMDGIAAAKEIRERFHLPVVFLTAFAEDSTLERAREAEPFGYILKPFEDRELRTNIEIALYKNKAEAEIRRLTRLYATLSEVNQAIVRVRSREELFANVCDIALEFGKFKAAWIALLDSAGSLLSVAQAGAESRAVSAINRCHCALEAVEKGKPCHINRLADDPRVAGCRELAVSKGLRSCAAYPIRLHEQICGVLVVGADEPGFNNEAETRLLKEVAMDISFALDRLEGERLRRQAEVALGEREQRLRTILETVLDGFWIVDRHGKILEVNDAACVMSGYTREELLQMHITDLESAETEQQTADHMRRIVRLGGDRFESRHRCKDGHVTHIEAMVTYQDFDGGRFVCFLRDITDRKQWEQEREATIEFLRVVNASTGTPEMIHAATTFFQKQSGCEAVGIRLQEGNDYPYFEARGFPTEFVQIENSLCARNDSGEIIGESRVNPRLECMCGNVICGRFDPSQPFFTTHGSFWTNSTTELLAASTEADRQSRTRDRCHGEGYESVALIPLRAGEERFGLLQLNDRRKGQFSPEIIALWERLADQMGIALAKFRTEEELRHSEDRLTQAVGVAGLGIYEYDPRTDVTTCSPLYREIFGFGPSDPVTKLTTIERVLPEDRDILTHAMKQTGDPDADGFAQVEYRIAGSDGIRWVSGRGQAFFQGDGSSRQLVRIVGAVQDITDRKQAELELSESKHRLQVALDAAKLGAWSRDLVTGDIFWDEQTRAILDLTADPVITYEKLVSLVSPGNREQFTRMFPLQQEGQPEDFAVDYPIIGPDGTKRLIHGRGSLSRDSAGRPIRLSGVVMDITDQKRAEQEKCLLEEQLRVAQRMEAVGRLAGGVAHDFNNLLMVIRSYTEIIQDHLPAHDSLRNHVQQVLKASDRAASLIGQLLAFSRKQIVAPVALDLNDVVNDAAKMLKRLIGEDIELTICPAAPLWATRIDPDQIVQVLMNLCVNARDAMPQGGTITITTCNIAVEDNEEYALLERKEYVMLSVADTGEGMTKEVQEHIFEPFYTTKPMGKGTGLGLSTVYGIVQQTGGRIWATSEPGQGTCFAICLPRTNEPKATASPARTEAVMAGGETLMVVEDEEALRESIGEFLRDLGYTVLRAASGQEALAKAGQYQEAIAVLITDVVMPKMSGRELSQMLASLRPNLKTIYMSGYTDDSVVRHGISESKVAFLQKPFSMATLARRLRAVIDAPGTITGPEPAVDN